ncbi:M3 family metallopeptidase, partial [Phenylobacterium sp.]
MKRRTFLAASGALAATQALSPPALAAVSANPLTQPWTGPFGGVPAFDKVKVADFQGAIELALAAERAEIDAIARNKAPPTFANTIEALELTGQMTSRVLTYYFIWTNTLASPDVQKVEEAVEPLLAAHQDAILQNAALFRRIDEVYTRGDHAGLTPEQRRLMWLHHTRFVRAGARLTGPQKARVAAINQELAGLFTRFSQNLLADETDYVLYLKSEAELTGLPDDVRAAAASAAEARGRKGEWAILNTRSSMDPFLTYSARRDLREKVWRTFYSRGDNGDAKDNNGLIRQILKLRAERAKLLGYATHAHWRLADSMAGSPEKAMELMTRVWPAAIARVREEVAEMQVLADTEKLGVKIEPWDYRYYAEKV